MHSIPQSSWFEGKKSPGGVAIRLHKVVDHDEGGIQKDINIKIQSLLKATTIIDTSSFSVTTRYEFLHSPRGQGSSRAEPCSK